MLNICSKTTQECSIGARFKYNTGIKKIVRNLNSSFINKQTVCFKQTVCHIKILVKKVHS